MRISAGLIIILAVINVGKRHHRRLYRNLYIFNLLCYHFRELEVS